MTEAQAIKQTVFSPDCCIQGQLDLHQDALILGQVDGTCRSAASLTIGPSGNLKGLVVVGNLKIYGSVDADIIVYGLIQVMTGARVRGRIFAQQIKLQDQIDMKVQLQVGENVIA